VDYPAQYSDQSGKETTTIQNDGQTLRMVIRGVEFVGDDFDSLESTISRDSAQLASFTFRYGYLGECIIECEIPIPVVVGAKVVPGSLHVHLDFRGSAPTRQEVLKLKLAYNEVSFESSGKSHGYFEYELWEIQAAMPKDTYIKACINCTFSNIGRYQGMFGALACYRGNKDRYFGMRDDRKPGSKWALLEIMTEAVQEVHLCPEFEPEMSSPEFSE